MKPHIQKRNSKLQKPRVLVFSGYGLNCEEEAAHGFTLAGGRADIVHINDVIKGKVTLKNYQILCFPGGFAYGDDTGSGKAYANRIRNHLGKELAAFIKEGKLVIGICNGFQILTQLGILPGALTYNDNNRYTDRWVDMKVEGNSPWLKGIHTFSAPIAHGEGKFFAEKKTMKKLKRDGSLVLRYYKGETATFQNLSANPNGALDNVAGVVSNGGRVLGLMPHPDRALFSWQLPNAPLTRDQAKRNGILVTDEGPGVAIFRNGVEYVKT